MSNKTVAFLAFIFGAAAGVAGAYYFVKKQYEEIAQEDFEARRELAQQAINMAANGGFDEDEDTAEEPNTPTEKPNIAEYAARLHREGYTNYSESNKKGVVNNNMKKPYVISPDEFGENPGYDTISLTYYLDGVLADEDDEKVEDMANTVGMESINHFGEYEDDSVFVRNDELKADYEILLDQRAYSEVCKTRPPKVEV